MPDGEVWVHCAGGTRAAIAASLLDAEGRAVVAALAALAAVRMLRRSGGAAGMHWAVAAPFTGAAIPGAWDVRRLAAREAGGGLQRLFAWELLGVAAFTLADALT
ncbi:hypothetical protein ACLQ2N_25190 [Streptomyces sp. DT224]|uniref:hypothetical protein n=1 Tax=Streptomyces sp. DT224 TaxID=3393426 RepID=UPI003CF43E5B